MFVVAIDLSLVLLFASLFDGLPSVVRVAALLLGLGAIAQTGVSLLASHWVYDRSVLYSLVWVKEFLPDPPQNIANIHAGFDETSDILSKIYPSAEIRILDFYDPERTTEKSIARARAAFPPSPSAQSVRVDSLPLSDASQDLVLLFLAAHEIRTDDERAKLFQEVRRSLRAKGRVILVEHLRDAPNAIAYGPGFLHFHSRATWLRAFASADLKVAAERKITPLIRVIVCSHSS